MVSRRRFTKEEALVALKKNDWLEAMRRLPDDVDVEVASEQVLEMVDGGSWLQRFGSDLPASVIEATLNKMRANPNSAWRLLLLELSKHGLAWEDRTAILGWLDRSHGWGSKQMREIFRALAGRPEVVSAMQTAVVGDPAAPMSMLAVLVSEGSESSIDALMPVFTKRNSVQLLRHLKTHAAKTTAVATMFEALDARSAARNKRSRATEVISKIVGAPLEKISLHIRLSSTELHRDGVPTHRGFLRVNSDEPVWWHVWLSSGDSVPITTLVKFGEGEMNVDALKLGAPTFEALPSWVKRAEKKVGIRFTVSDPRSSSLRGKKRDAFRDWFFNVNET